jgi:hypothetical protein
VSSGVGAGKENTAATTLTLWSDGGILRTRGASDRPGRDTGAYPVQGDGRTPHGHRPMAWWPGGRTALTGGPRCEETTNDRWARSYLIFNQNKCQKMNSPRGKIARLGEKLSENL